MCPSIRAIDAPGGGLPGLARAVDGGIIIAVLWLGISVVILRHHGHARSKRAVRDASGTRGSGSAREPTEVVDPRRLTAAQAVASCDRGDGDARLSREEFRGPPLAFSQMDADGDGLLTREELEAFWRARVLSAAGGSRRRCVVSV